MTILALWGITIIVLGWSLAKVRRLETETMMLRERLRHAAPPSEPSYADLHPSERWP